MIKYKYGLLLISFLLIYSNVNSQCGCLDDLFKNDPEKYKDQIKELFNGAFFTEGPAVDSAGNVYFSDLTFTSEIPDESGHIWKYSPATGKTTIYRSPSGMSNGMIIDKNDNLYICEGADTGGRRIVKTNLKTGKSIILADNYNGKHFNSPNDITVTNDGTVYFTDSRYSGNEQIEQDINGVYRILPSKEVQLVIAGIPMPNGITVTPDNSKLYVGSYNEEADEDNPNFIAAYTVDDSGNVNFEKYIAKFLSGTGPDGIKLGPDGNIFVALRDEYRPGIYIYSTGGVLLNKILMKEVPSNLTFSKTDDNVLYVTAGGSLLKVMYDNTGS